MTRGSLGIELSERVEVGPLTVDELGLALPGLAFPVDLSGGVRVFRHRRGQLAYLGLTLERAALQSWLAPRLRELEPRPQRAPELWTTPEGIGIGLVGEASALAFELWWAPDDCDARLVVAAARGAGLAGPALGAALRVVDACLSGVSVRRGRVVYFAEPALALARAVLPAAGARAPSVVAVRPGALTATDDGWAVRCDATFAPAPLTAASVRALELGALCAAADDALAQGRLDVARAEYVRVLERAPRDPEITRIVAEIDVLAGGRADAALGLLSESLAPSQAGVVGGELLIGVGDEDGALEAFAGSARGEPYAPLAALAWARFAALARDPRLTHEALDRAVALCPGLAGPRWLRFDRRVAQGDVVGALADAEHLEAAAVGSRARHEVLVRAARAVLDAGYVADAGRAFERALRYLPDDAAATAGLGRALVEAGRVERGIGLLARAAHLGEHGGAPDGDLLIDLARALAAHAGDLPHAIARVRQVPPSSQRACEARAHEARWRSALGDVAGASLAWARARELAELGRADAHAAEWLAEAARFEREVQADVHAAERHLAVALRLAPRDARISQAYREAAALVAARSRRAREQQEIRERVPAPRVAAVDPRELDAEAERLIAALRADPGAADVPRLATVLAQLGRDEELFALLSARLDDGEPGERALVVPAYRELLVRLSAAAARAGKSADVALYDALLARVARD